MLNSACPNVEALRAFAIGLLPGHDVESLAAHVENCQNCQGRLAEFDDDADQLAEQLQHLPLERQREGVASHSSTVILDIGRDLTRRLAAGPVRLDRFELQSELGVGSFGYVFRAWDPEHQRIVALKVQRAGSFATPEDTLRFLREARSAARLSHPAIVAIYETGQTADGVVYLVCEFVDGETLERRLRAGQIAPRDAAQIAAELADALQYAHEHGVIHRDIKPSNILIDRAGRAHLMDFGLAKQQFGEATMTSDGRVMGTPAYMSPEQARGASHTVDARSDVYSLGVVLYEMLTGQRPFQGDRRELLLAVLDEDPPAPRSIRRDIPRQLEVVCQKAMNKSPGQRYQSAGQLACDLHCFEAGRPIFARPMGYVARTLRWCRRYPLAVSVLAAVLVGSVAGLIYLSSLSEYFVQKTALEGARRETKVLDEAWRFYSEEIQDIDPKSNIVITEKYKTVHPSLPLPATFAIDLGERISQRSPGMEVRVFSRYPWPDRTGGGPQDAADEEALAWLEANAQPGVEPPAEFAKFVSHGGERKLLYYSARHMETSCLGCHNHPQGPSPKKDWKVGDVVGVLKVVRPLNREIDSTRHGLRGAFVLMGSTAAVLVAMSLGVMLLRSRRKGAA